MSMSVWQSLLKMRLGLVVGLSAWVTGALFVQAGWAEERSPLAPLQKGGTELPEILRVSTSAKMLLSQEAEPAAVAKITRVTVNRTETGLEIVLATSDGKPVPVDANNFTTQGTALIADISNAVLSLPDQTEFRADNPTEDITTVQVTQLDSTTVRISVAGTTALPTTEVTLKTGELVYVLNSEEEPEIEIVVTGEQETGYFVPNASTATRTDTPLRDIPQSIQVVPRQVLEDRKPRTLTEAVETVSGVLDSADYFGGPGGGRIIRGFIQSGNYRNGTRDIVGSSSNLTAIGTIEQIEVLKGPGSVLFGAVEPGGIVNVITRQPLSTPYYNLAFETGNFGFYQPSLDLSGPLTSDKTLLYRFIANYRDSGSFQDFVNQNLTTIAPSFTFNFGDRTVVNLYYELFHLSGVPEVTTTLTNDGRQVPRSRYLGYPQFGDLNTTQQRYGYSLSHQLSDNWHIRNIFSVADLDRDEQFTAMRELIDDRFMRLSAVDRDVTEDNYYGQIDLLGKFNTGAVLHQLLVGFDFIRFIVDTDFRQDNTLPFLDIFNPNYDFSEAVNDFFFTAEQSVQTYGIYLQDQISLLDNLKLLIGGRIDFTSQNSSFRGVEAPEQNDTAFSPRV